MAHVESASDKTLQNDTDYQNSETVINTEQIIIIASVCVTAIGFAFIIFIIIKCCINRRVTAQNDVDRNRHFYRRINRLRQDPPVPERTVLDKAIHNSSYETPRTLISKSDNKFQMKGAGSYQSVISEDEPPPIPPRRTYALADQPEEDYLQPTQCIEQLNQQDSFVEEPFNTVTENKYLDSEIRNEDNVPTSVSSAKTHEEPEPRDLNTLQGIISPNEENEFTIFEKVETRLSEKKDNIYRSSLQIDLSPSSNPTKSPQRDDSNDSSIKHKCQKDTRSILLPPLSLPSPSATLQIEIKGSNLVDCEDVKPPPIPERTVRVSSKQCSELENDSRTPKAQTPTVIVHVHVE